MSGVRYLIDTVLDSRLPSVTYRCSQSLAGLGLSRLTPESFTANLIMHLVAGLSVDTYHGSSTRCGLFLPGVPVEGSESGLELVSFPER